jgi:hypothetical protein
VRPRSGLAILFLVLGCLLVPVADVGIWTQRVVLDTDQFTSLSDNLLRRDDVRGALATAVLEELEQSQPQIRPVRGVLEPAVRDLMATQQFAQIFHDEIERLHGQLVNDGDRLSLNFDPALALITDRISAVDPGAAALVPSGDAFGEVVLVQRDQAPYLWGGVEVARWVSIIAIAAMIVLLGLGVALARRPALALGAAGLGVALASVAVAVILSGAQAYTAHWIRVGAYRDGFRVTWDVVAGDLRAQTLLIGIVGVAAAVIGFLVQAGMVGRLGRAQPV